MAETSSFSSPGNLDAALRSLRSYFLAKGNDFSRGPYYQSSHGDILVSVEKTAEMYTTLGYTLIIALGAPPIYAFLKRGNREIHLFQPQDPKVQQWLQDPEAHLNDSAMRAYLLQQGGMQERDLPVNDPPLHFHINEVDGIFIATTDEQLNTLGNTQP